MQEGLKHPKTAAHVLVQQAAFAFAENANSCPMLSGASNAASGPFSILRITTVLKSRVSSCGGRGQLILAVPFSSVIHSI